MHQLSRSEAALLAAETNTNLGHQSLVLELAPSPDGQELTLSRLRAVIDESLHLAPSLRRPGLPSKPIFLCCLSMERINRCNAFSRLSSIVQVTTTNRISSRG